MKMNEDDYVDLEKVGGERAENGPKRVLFSSCSFLSFPCASAFLFSDPRRSETIGPKIQVGMLGAGAEFDLLQDQRWVRVRLSVRQEQRPSAR